MIPTVLIAGILIGLLPFRFAVASVVPVSAG